MAQKGVFFNKLRHECYDQAILVTTELESSPRCCRIVLDEYVASLRNNKILQSFGFSFIENPGVKLQIFDLCF